MMTLLAFVSVLHFFSSSSSLHYFTFTHYPFCEHNSGSHCWSYRPTETQYTHTHADFKRKLIYIVELWVLGLVFFLFSSSSLCVPSSSSIFFFAFPIHHLILILQLLCCWLQWMDDGFAVFVVVSVFFLLLSLGSFQFGSLSDPCKLRKTANWSRYNGRTETNGNDGKWAHIYARLHCTVMSVYVSLAWYLRVCRKSSSKKRMSKYRTICSSHV